MPRTITVESFEEFTARQGCEHETETAASPRTGENIFHAVFENGASSDGYLHREPPDDPAQLLGIKIEYWKRRVEHFERLFGECKNYISMQCAIGKSGFGPNPPEEAFADLDRFRDGVHDSEAKLAELEAELKELRGPQPFDERMEHLDRQRQKANELLARAMRTTL